jgi:hypothetical protein
VTGEIQCQLEQLISKFGYEKVHDALVLLTGKYRRRRLGRFRRVCGNWTGGRSGRHAVAERVSMERHEIAQLEPARVAFVHLSDAGDLILGEVVPIIVA